MKHNTCPPCSGNCDQGRACPGAEDAKAAAVQRPLRYLVNTSRVRLAVCVHRYGIVTVRLVTLSVGRAQLSFSFTVTR